MKPFFLLLVLLVIACNQVAYAEDSGQVQDLENEINALRQAAVDQRERIQSLESRVSAQGLPFAKSKSSPATAVSNTDDGQLPRDSVRVQDGLNQKYID